MHTPDQEPLPDVAVGHHHNYGVVAANPKNLPASTWMLERLDFHPVPGEPNLYALADQQRDAQGRATRTVTLLRNAGFRVDADAAFDPSLVPGAAPGRDRAALGEPEVAFAEHLRLGIVAAIDDRASGFTGLALVEHGWRHNHALDIYELPAATGRDEALGKVASATLALHRSGVQVAVQPRLAQDVAARRGPAPAPAAPHERRQSAPRASPITAAAIAASPARAGLPGNAPVPAPVAPATRPIDPRISFSRDR
ncbi:hypothetical protein ACFXPT_07600 [Streptomyces goshikiensis]|uniref:hypothetical protein n=1 Tax=Streptomyces goshikiensis TaxID=1942 RepID=UPI0036C4BAAA